MNSATQSYSQEAALYFLPTDAAGKTVVGQVWLLATVEKADIKTDRQPPRPRAGTLLRGCGKAQAGTRQHHLEALQLKHKLKVYLHYANYH